MKTKRKPDFGLRQIVLEARRRPSEEAGLGVEKAIKEEETRTIEMCFVLFGLW